MPGGSVLTDPADRTGTRLLEHELPTCRSTSRSRPSTDAPSYRRKNVRRKSRAITAVDRQVPGILPKTLTSSPGHPSGSRSAILAHTYDSTTFDEMIVPSMSKTASTGSPWTLTAGRARSFELAERGHAGEWTSWR